MANVAFFGPGKMGEPMAEHLLDAGHQVVVVPHRDRGSLERLKARGAREAATPAEAARQTDVAIMILPTSAEVEEQLFGPSGIAEAMRPGYTVIDMGSDEFTVGRLHPMLDPGLRHQRLLREAEDPEVAVILLDVVLQLDQHFASNT